MYNSHFAQSQSIVTQFVMCTIILQVRKFQNDNKVTGKSDKLKLLSSF